MKMNNLFCTLCLLICLNAAKGLELKTTEVALTNKNITIRCLFDAKLPSWTRQPFNRPKEELFISDLPDINPEFPAKDRIKYANNKKDLILMNVTLQDAGHYISSYINSTARGTVRYKSNLTLLVDDLKIIDKNSPKGESGRFFITTGCLNGPVEAQWMFILPNNEHVDVKDTNFTENSTGCPTTESRFTSWYSYRASNRSRRVNVYVKVDLLHNSTGQTPQISITFPSNEYYIDGCCDDAHFVSIGMISPVLLCIVFLTIWVAILIRRGIENKINPQLPNKTPRLCECKLHDLKATIVSPMCFGIGMFFAFADIFSCVWPLLKKEKKSKEEEEEIPLNPKVRYEERKDEMIDLIKAILKDTVTVDWTAYETPELSSDSKSKISLYDVFSDGRKQFSRIYITGDEGLGKTAFCDMLSLAWMSDEQVQEFIPFVFKNAMDKFEFLFYIPLKLYKNVREVSEMIKSHYFVNNEDLFNDFMRWEDKKHSCFIILDGLEQWAPPEDQNYLNLPNLKNLRECTVLITSRKLTLHFADMDRKILLNNISLKKFVDALTPTLGIECTKRLTDQTFRSNMADIHFPPSLLKYFLALWKKDKETKILSSRVKLHIDILEEMIQNKCKDDTRSLTITQNASTEKLPTCFNNKEFCLKFSRILFSLAKLAFAISKKRYEQIKELDESHKRKCLEIGILCEKKEDTGEKLTFLSKSFEDFFTALYLTMTSNEENMSDVYGLLWDREENAVFVFMSGLNSKLTTYALDELYIITKPVLNPELSNARYNVMQLQKLLCQCVQESMENGKCIDCKVDHIIIDDDYSWEVLPNLIEKNKSRIKSIELRIVSHDPNKLNLECLNHVTGCSSVERFSLALYESVPETVERQLQIAANKWSLSSLELFGNISVTFLEYMSSEKVAALTKLRISDLFITTQLLKHMQTACQLKTLEITQSMDSHNNETLVLELSELKMLQRLESMSFHQIIINTTSLDYCKAYASPISLVHNETPINIRVFIIHNIIDSNYSLRHIAEILPKMEKLVHLELVDLYFGDIHLYFPQSARSLKTVELNICLPDNLFVDFLGSVPDTNHEIEFSVMNVSEKVESYIENNFVRIIRNCELLCFKNKPSELK